MMNDKPIQIRQPAPVCRIDSLERKCSHIDEKGELAVDFHAFGDNFHAEISRDIDDGMDQDTEFTQLTRTKKPEQAPAFLWRHC